MTASVLDPTTTTTAGTTNAPPAGSSPEGTPEGASPTGEQKPQGTQPTEPKQEGQKPAEPKPEETKYDLKIDGTAFDNEDFVKEARSLKLSSEGAQKLLDKLAPALQVRVHEKIVAERDATVAKWAEETKADKTFGGEHLAENLALVHRALKVRGGDKIADLLKKTGFGNQLDVLSWIAEFGRMLTPDGKFVSGTPGGAEPPRDPLDRLADTYRKK